LSYGSNADQEQANQAEKYNEKIFEEEERRLG
jgi:hypothetical protein